MQNRPSLDALLRMDFVRHHVQRYARHVLQLGSTTIQHLGLVDPKSTADPTDSESTTPRSAPTHTPPQLVKKPAAAGGKAKAPPPRQNLMLAPNLVPAPRNLQPRGRAISEGSIGAVARKAVEADVRTSAGGHRVPGVR